MVYREVCTKGSETTNSGTDEQKLDMRLNKPDKQAHHCDVQNPKGKCLLGRFSRDWRKEYALTWGGLSNHELDWEKSAEAIVATGNEPRIETVEDSQRSEGLNVKFVPNSIRKLLGLSQSSLIINKDRRHFGVKSEMLILGEPLYTRPVCTVV